MIPSTGDPIADKALFEASVKLATELIKDTFRSLKSLPEWLKGKYAQHDPFDYEARKYIESLSRRYDKMRVLGMSSPVPIRTIYVRVNILKKITSRQRQTVEELEDVFNKDKNSFGTIQGTEDGIKVANREQRLIVLGKPGAGKTTFLKWLALGAIDGRFDTPRIPIFVSLKDWSDSKKNLITFIHEEFSVCGFEDSRLFVDQLLSTGNAIILLDGYDEVGNRIDEAIKEIQTLSAKYPKISMILSCRTASYSYVFPDFKDVEIADFSNEQIKQFVKNWFHSNTGTDNKCIHELSLPRNRGIANLCPTPLLLTLLCLTYEDTLSFPQNRAELYKEAIDALLKKWDATRSIIRESSYKALSLAKKELLLSRLAFNTFANNRYFIKQDYLEREIADFLANLKSASPEVSDIEGERVLKEIEAQHGLLVERAHRIYSFSHLTFQEFFTARQITSNTNKKYGPDYLVKTHLNEPRWNEVFILTTGLLEEADDFLLDIRASLSRMITSNKLISLLSRICEMVKPSTQVPEPVRRALAMRYVTGEIGKFDLKFRNSFEASKELISDMEKEFGELKNLDFETIRALRLGLHAGRQVLDGIVADINKLPTEHTRTLTSYIRGTRLLVNCLNVDAYVSVSVRDAIVKSIFLEPWNPPAPSPKAIRV